MSIHRRGGQVTKATDRLQKAAEKIRANVNLLETVEAMNDRAVALASVKKQMEEGIEEMDAAIIDIKSVAARL